MKRSKKISILLGILALACIATFAVTRVEERKEKIKNSDEIILEIPGDDVKSLSWEYESETLAFHKDDKWLYDGDEAFPVSEDKIKELLSPFASFGVSFIIEDVEDYGQYGLEDPICTIDLATEEQSFKIQLGDYSKMDSERYVSIGDGRVYLVKNDPLDYFNAKLSDMIDNDEVPSFEQATDIDFSGSENYSIAYEEDSTASWCAQDVYFTQKDGGSQPLDTENVKNYLSGITSLNLSDYASYNVTEEELHSYGLDSPELTVTVNYTEESEEGEKTENTFLLNVGRDPEEKKAAEKTEEAEPEKETEAAEEAGLTDAEEKITAYARVGESQIVYKISAEEYKNLMAASFDDLRHQEIFTADFADVDRIDISLEGADYTITSKKEDEERIWYYQGEEISLTNFIGSVKALEADSFTGEEPAQKEEISLTIHLDHENFPEIRIGLYRYDGTNCLAVVNGKPVALVSRTSVVDVIEAVHAIIL